jgi:hypothetical protein
VGWLGGARAPNNPSGRRGVVGWSTGVGPKASFHHLFLANDFFSAGCAEEQQRGRHAASNQQATRRRPHTNQFPPPQSSVSSYPSSSQRGGWRLTPATARRVEIDPGNSAAALVKAQRRRRVRMWGSLGRWGPRHLRRVGSLGAPRGYRASRSLPEAWSAAELPGVPKSAPICDVGLMLRMWATSPCLVSCPHIYRGLDATPAACLLFDHAASWRWLQRQHGAGDIPIEKCRPLSSFTCSACLCLSCWLFSSKLTCAPHFVCFQSSLPPRVSWNQSDTSPNHMLTAG